jgi:ribA/ribD-fused uncharacterized protein
VFFVSYTIEPWIIMSRKDLIPSIEPIFVRHRDIASQNGPDNNFIKPIDLCQAMAEKITSLEVLGAQKISGLWRLYTKSQESRVKIIISGININGNHIIPFDKNPIATNSNDPSERREKIIIKDIPLSADNKTIMDTLKSFPQVKMTSGLMYSHERNEDGRLTAYMNGDRYIYAKYPISPVLPYNANFGIFKGRIYHQTQKDNCKRCGQVGHKHKDTDQCPAYISHQDIVAFKGHTNPLSNMFPCDVEVGDQIQKSSEHAFQWVKATDLNYSELAERILNAEHAGSAKNLSKEIPEEESERWSKDHGIETMKRILKAKLIDSVDFYTALIETGSSYIVEATPNKFWGCGLTPENAATTKPAYWTGQNMLGALLMELRNDELQKLDEAERRSGALLDAHIQTLSRGENQRTDQDEMSSDDEESSEEESTCMSDDIEQIQHTENTAHTADPTTKDKGSPLKTPQGHSDNISDATLTPVSEIFDISIQTPTAASNRDKSLFYDASYSAAGRKARVKRRTPRTEKRTSSILKYLRKKKKRPATSPLQEKPSKTSKTLSTINNIDRHETQWYLNRQNMFCCLEPYDW